MVGFVIYTRGVYFPEESKLDLHTGFLFMQEMLGHWPQIVSFLGSTGQPQHDQLFHRRVSSWFVILWYSVNCFLFRVFSHKLLQGTST